MMIPRMPGVACKHCGTVAAACARRWEAGGSACCGLCHRDAHHRMDRDALVDACDTADAVRSFSATYQPLSTSEEP